MKLIVIGCLALLAPMAASADSFEEHDFILHCAGCHGLTGSGSATVPSLYRIGEVAFGAGSRSYMVRVPGVAQAPLSDERLAALLNWVITNFIGTAPFAPYLASDVRALRVDPLRDPIEVRRRLFSAPSVPLR